MGRAGLEPARLSTWASKAHAATSYATCPVELHVPRAAGTSPLRRSQITLPPDDAAARAGHLRVRAGRPDSRAGARAGSHLAPPREALPRRRSRASLPDARRRRDLLHQLRLRL